MFPHVCTRIGNYGLGFRRHRIQIPYGSSKHVFKTDPEFQLKGNIAEPANPPPQWGDTWASAWADARGYCSSRLAFSPDHSIYLQEVLEVTGTLCVHRTRVKMLCLEYEEWNNHHLYWIILLSNEKASSCCDASLLGEATSSCEAASLFDIAPSC